MANGKGKKYRNPGETGEVILKIQGDAFKDLDYLLKNDGQRGAPTYTRSAIKAIQVYAGFLRKKSENDKAKQQKGISK